MPAKPPPAKGGPEKLKSATKQPAARWVGFDEEQSASTSHADVVPSAEVVASAENVWLEHEAELTLSESAAHLIKLLFAGADVVYITALSDASDGQLLRAQHGSDEPRIVTCRPARALRAELQSRPRFLPSVVSGPCYHEELGAADR